MSHPPLCPGTEEWFIDGGDFVQLGHMEEGNIWHIATWCSNAERRLICRYQACAWRDLRDEWLGKIAIPGDVADGEAKACERNADAWREWEKQA